MGVSGPFTLKKGRVILIGVEGVKDVKEKTYEKVFCYCLSLVLFS
jgi:hypothetical protein